MKIGQVAKEAKVRVDTIRYYERLGLVKAARRRPSGYREFTGETVRRILFIKRAQELGFSLHEIQELLELQVDPVGSCAEVRAHTLEKLNSVEERIRSLQAMRRTLRELVDACDHQQSVGECPILASLNEGG